MANLYLLQYLMDEQALTAFYGGTFDPIHYGHLQPVIALAHLISLKQIIVLPNNVPPHRPQPSATSQQRLAMLQLALADAADKQDKLFIIDKRELQRNTPSWTVETFRALRYEYGTRTPLGFIIGQDSLLTLPQWYRSRELLNLCHILVCARPGYVNSFINDEQDKRRLTNDPNALYHQPAGLVYCAATPELAISASEIRRRYRKGLPCNGLLPITVQRYIEKQGLYR